MWISTWTRSDRISWNTIATGPMYFSMWALIRSMVSESPVTASKGLLRGWWRQIGAPDSERSGCSDTAFSPTGSTSDADDHSLVRNGDLARLDRPAGLAKLV